MVCRELDEGVVVDGARSRDDDIARLVSRGVEARDLGLRGIGDDRRVADDRPPQRMVRKDRVAEHVEDLLLGIVLVHRDLLEDDRALRLDLRERRPEDHVGDHVERLREMLVDHPRIYGRGLLAGAGVQLRTHPVEDLIDLERRVLRAAFEQQVLEQMREPGLGLGLAARARADPEAERDGSDGGHVLRHDPYARIERR